MPQSYDNVVFEFFHASEPLSISRGKVIVREGEMVLDVEYTADSHYDIRGKSAGQFYEGRHMERKGDVSVHAKWILLDDTYLGIWAEGQQEYLFRFTLRDAD